MAEVKRGRGYVYSIQYHIVWCVKYRHKVLVGDIDSKLKEILNKVTVDNAFVILEIETDCDYVHLLIDLNITGFAGHVEMTYTTIKRGRVHIG